MNYAVFFRNLNLGRPNCPSKAQLERAFLAAGASAAASFQVNGTLAFSAAPGTPPHRLLALACQHLRAECGLREPAFLRRLDDLAGLVALAPFAAVDRSTVYECCVTFLHPDSPALPPAPWQSRRGDVEVLRFTDAEAFSLSRKLGSSPGSPNAALEKLLGQPGTTRSWNTLLRLLDKHG